MAIPAIPGFRSRLEAARRNKDLALGLVNFMVVQVGKISYTQDDIVSVSISFGKSGTSAAAAVPTATIVVHGFHDISLSTKVIVTCNLYRDWIYLDNDISRRFTGRVGAQEYDPENNTTTFLCSGESVRMFTSENAVMVNPATDSMHAIVMAVHRSLPHSGLVNPIDVTLRGLDNADRPYMPRGLDFVNPEDIFALLEKNRYTITHRRTGEVVFRSPDVRTADMIEQGRNPRTRTIKMDNIKVGTQFEQPRAAIDSTVKVEYRTSSTNIASEDWTANYYPVDQPHPGGQPKKLDLTDMIYKTFNWRYPMRVATFEQLRIGWQAPKISVDLLALIEHESGVWDFIGQVAAFAEGDAMFFGADWRESFRGIRVIQGYTEKYDHETISFDFSLADPALVFGYSDFRDPFDISGIK